MVPMTHHLPIWVPGERFGVFTSDDDSSCGRVVTPVVMW